MAAKEHDAVASEFDSYRDSYSETVNKALIVPGLDVDYFTRVKAEMLLDIVRQHFGGTDGVSLLDVGCGVGNYHPLLIGRVGRLTGVEISQGSIDTARLANPDVNYVAYDGDTLPFGDGAFDAAYAICVVHHVPPASWTRFFKELHRIVRPGGLAMIFEHNPANPLTRRVVDRCPFDRDAVLLPRRQTHRLLRDAGFQAAAPRTILTIPSFGPVTRAIDRALGAAPFGAQYVAIGTKAS